MRCGGGESQQVETSKTRLIIDLWRCGMVENNTSCDHWFQSKVESLCLSEFPFPRSTDSYLITRTNEDRRENDGFQFLLNMFSQSDTTANHFFNSSHLCCLPASFTYHTTMSFPIHHAVLWVFLHPCAINIYDADGPVALMRSLCFLFTRSRLQCFSSWHLFGRICDADPSLWTDCCISFCESVAGVRKYVIKNTYVFHFPLDCDQRELTLEDMSSVWRANLPS